MARAASRSATKAASPPTADNRNTKSKAVALWLME